MAVEERIINDIVWIIKELISVLEKKKVIFKLFDSFQQGFIAEMLYGLYNFDRDFHEHFTDVLSAEVNPKSRDFIDKLFLRYCSSLKKAHSIVHEFSEKNEWFVSIVWHSWVMNYILEKTVRMRLYINAKPDNVHKVVKHILDRLKTKYSKCFSCGKRFGREDMKRCSNCQMPRKGLCMFKFIQHGHAKERHLLRTDKLVMYFDDDKTELKDFAAWLHKKASHFMNPDVPRFTNKLYDGIGFAYEPEAKHVDYMERLTGRRGTSFGEFMSWVITRYLMSRCIKYGRLPSDSEIKDIAKAVYEEKLKKKHAYEFEI